MSIRKTIALVQVVSLLFFNVWPIKLARSDDSDIFGSNIQPNVVILLDQSGSMNDQIASISYDPNTTYSGSKTSTKVYKKDDGDWVTYKNTVAEVNSSSAQTALNTLGTWSGSISGSNLTLYTGNYINYTNCSSCQGLATKISIAKSVITTLLNSVTGVRFGIMKFQNSDSPYGATMVSPIGTATSTMVTAVNAITAGNNTPTGEALRDVGKYYNGTFSQSGTTYASPIQYSCQPNFVIVLSDGLWNGSVNPATQATTEYTTDHSSTISGMQNLIVDTVGFNLPAGDPGVTSLQLTATNGGGVYYTANNEAQLAQALRSAISQIIAATFTFATIVVPTTGASGSTRDYLASFTSNPSSPFWKGFLKAYTRDSNGLLPVDANGVPSGTPVWDAGQVLSQKSASSRTIYTVASGTRQDFTKSNTAITNTLLNASSTAEHDKIIDFVRGIDSYDEDADGNTTEERAWKLGDIFHSTPVLVGPPFLLSTDTTYNTFKSDNASRTTVLLAGANDGMIHAFRESDGQELWAFIPPNVLGNLKTLTVPGGVHPYYADASPIVADVKIGGTWKTIVVFGERRGGKNYYALDITDTTNPLYLWSFTDSKLGETWSEPVIGKVKKSDGTDIFVAFVGGGYDTTFSNYTSGTNLSEAFFVINLADGTKLWEYYNAGGSTNDWQYMNFSIPASPTAVDLNNDGYIDRVYIGDVGGQIWKFDVSAAATISGGLVTNWSGKRMFAAASSQANPPAAGEFYPTQAMYGRPSLAYDSAGNLWLFMGTGDRYHPNSTASNRFYGIKENTTMTNGSANTLTESSLTNLSSGTGTVTQGWYVVLASNEKVLSASDVFNKTVYFTSFTPTTTVTCGGGGGNGKLYAINMTSGDAAIDLSTGQTVAAGQSALALGKAIGAGIPSRPVIIVNPSGNTGTPYIITGSTSQQITNTQAPSFTMRKLVAWREVF